MDVAASFPWPVGAVLGVAIAGAPSQSHMNDSANNASTKTRSRLPETRTITLSFEYRPIQDDSANASLIVIWHHKFLRNFTISDEF